MSGKLYALSSGPGAADLITVRAARILGQLDVLYAPAGRKGGDSLALSIVREYLGAHTEVRCCHFPMSADSAEKEAVWNDVAAALAQEVKMLSRINANYMQNDEIGKILARMHEHIHAITG